MASERTMMEDVVPNRNILVSKFRIPGTAVFVKQVTKIPLENRRKNSSSVH